MSEVEPVFENTYGKPHSGMDMLPKPTSGKLPLLITGGSQQDLKWIAQNGDGWMIYPRNITMQAPIVSNWRSQIEELGRADQPVMEPLYLDLVEDPDTPPLPILSLIHI